MTRGTILENDVVYVPRLCKTGNRNSLVDTIRSLESEHVTNPDQIVIVGMACRFPGADTPEQYWLNLLDAGNCCGPVERWPDASASLFRGGLLDDVSLFDANFFRISPREARCMDPQQRILMEVAYHAIENSGASPELLRELDCGVFCTSLPGDYKFLFLNDSGAVHSSHTFLGNANAALSGRLSYFFDFSGPSITIDTACSSSLVALKMACASIARGDCEAALVGAASVFATDEIFRFTREANILSSAGRCSAFGRQADGFVPAEGAAALIIMSARRAAEIGLKVLGIVAAIGINHDGNSQGLMAPNPAAQEELIVRTFVNNDVPVSLVGYVEAHGTGTIVGDRVELDALERAYARLGATKPSFLGASKAVIGHTLVCSGLAGVIKALKIFEHELIPAHPIAHSVADGGNFILNRSATAWPGDKEYISVSAFGFTGTNAHLLLAKPVPIESPSNVTDDRPMLFPFSAATKSALRARLDQFRTFIANVPADRLQSLQATLACGREHHKFRAAVVAETKSELMSGLAALIALQIDELAGSCRGVNLDTLVFAREWRDWLEIGNPAPREGQPTPRYSSTLPSYLFERKSYWIGKAPVAHKPLSRDGENSVVSKLRAVAAEPLEYSDEVDAARSLAAANIVSDERLIDWVRPASAGLPLILLPPLNMDASAWTQQISTFKRNGYAPHIAIYPGHAGRICPPEPFNLERLAEDIAVYAREALGTRSVPVIGWSLGGCLAMTLARLAPEVPSSLILISTAARFDDDVFGRTIDLHQEIQSHADYLGLVFGESRDRIVAHMGAGASMEVLMRYYEQLTTFDAVSTLDCITQPTLIVHGNRDAVISEGDISTLRSIPGSLMIEIERHGHFIPLTAARAFNEATLRFLADVGS